MAYVKIRNFGVLPDSVRLDPIASSIVKDIDMSMDEGASSRLFGPDQPNSQLFMAERCAKNWDGACELLYRNNDPTKCNAGKIDSTLFRSSPSGMTIGDFLVENSAVRRFCDLSSCAISSEPYNPMDPDSVNVTSYGIKQGMMGMPNKQCLPVCMPPSNPDHDLLLNKVLDRPHFHTDLLINMYHNVRDRKAYENTRLGIIFNVFDSYFRQ